MSKDLKALMMFFICEGRVMPSQKKIDEVDINIVRTLQKDARTTFVDIAKNCDVSIDTISKRFKKLKRTGIVRGTTILLNPKQFGYDCVASLEIDIDYPHVEEIIDFIRKKRDVIFCTSIMGRHDIFCIAVLKNVGRLSKLIEIIKGHPLIREVTASIWVDEILLCPENFEFEHLKKE
jgi:Lrp/AsnC family transcriptional regulator for asnA, asnC and gidA